MQTWAPAVANRREPLVSRYASGVPLFSSFRDPSFGAYLRAFTDSSPSAPFRAFTYSNPSAPFRAFTYSSPSTLRTSPSLISSPGLSRLSSLPGQKSCPKKLVPSSTELLNQHVRFWLPQFWEHAMFIARDLNHPAFKSAFLRNLQGWNLVFQKQIHFLPVLKHLMYKQRLLLSALSQGIPLGSVPIALVQHMLEEEEYFLKVLNQCISPAEERAFWLKESAEHTRLAGQMIDPHDKMSIMRSNETLNLADDLNNLAVKWKEIKSTQSLQELAQRTEMQMETALKGAQDLAKADARHKVHLLIQPDMLQHEIREAEQAKFRLSLLQT